MFFLPNLNFLCLYIKNTHPFTFILDFSVKNMQNNATRRCELPDDEWFKRGGGPLKPIPRTRIKIPPAGRDHNPVLATGPIEEKAQSVNRRGTQSGGGARVNTPSANAQSGGGAGVNTTSDDTQSGEGAGANTSTTVIQSGGDAGK